MLEPIKYTTFHGKSYNLESHIDDLVMSNYECFQEVGQVLIFSSLLIWITMNKVSPISEVDFTITSPLAMKHFQCFTPKEKSIGPSIAEEMFEN